MSLHDTDTDRSRDVSQPVEKLSPDERLKAGSDQLRGTIIAGFGDEITRGLVPDDQKLMKFHGLYQQDDRDVRDERRRQRLEPAFSYMIRVRLPGGVCSSRQWLKLDELARAFGSETLRLTTRQTFQFHRVLRHNLRTVMQGLRDVGLDTRAACGDDSRGVMCSVNPRESVVHEEVYAIAKRVSDAAVPKTGAYNEIFYGEARHDGGGQPEEPFYGKTYMPRKFKIGFVVPPINDIDVYAQDLGFIAIVTRGKLIGFNVAIGGGLGRSDQAKETYPRLADVIGFVPVDQVSAVVNAVMGTQRDFGDRRDRAHARFKYTIDDKGLDWIKAEIESRLGYGLEPARGFKFESNGDRLGWAKGENGREHFTLRIQNGRIANGSNGSLFDALRDIARLDSVTFRVTPNQNLIFADATKEARKDVERVMREHGVDYLGQGSGIRRNSMACVALPTCGLAMAEAERYMPELIGKIEAITESHGLFDDPITLRLTGCPNGCARPYIAEIGLTGRAPGKYNLYVGGGFHGQRLNKMILENAAEAAILKLLDSLIGQYAKERKEHEHFGDFVIRAGHVAAVERGRDFNS